MQAREPREFWHPLGAGVALGLALLLTFLITGHGLGASGFFTALTAAVSDAVAPAWTAANAYLKPYLGMAGGPLAGWITWEVVGVAVGALAGSLAAGRFRVTVDRTYDAAEARSSGVGVRLLRALAGGALVGFGARLARGCTSGLGLSGSATLAVAGFLFLIGFFAAGFMVSFVVGRIGR